MIFSEHEPEIAEKISRSFGDCEIQETQEGISYGAHEPRDSITPLEGLIREIGEELQLKPSPEDLKYVRTVYVFHPLVKYKLHLFRWSMPLIPIVTINPKEHKALVWQSVSKIIELSLLEGQLEAYNIIFGKFS